MNIRAGARVGAVVLQIELLAPHIEDRAVNALNVQGVEALAVGGTQDESQHGGRRLC